MKITILIDNYGPKDLLTEWGFSVYIERDDKKYLLDSGAGEKYIINAQKLGIDLSDVDYAVLSHAHYDHASGFDSFFTLNERAKLYMSSDVFPNCYLSYGLIKKYIGIPQDFLAKYKNRIEYVGDLLELEPGVFIMRHQTSDYRKNAKKNHMVVKEKNRCHYDNFKHEQNLIIRTTRGLVIINSCSHIGADKILDEVKNAFPNDKIYMYIGGLHLFTATRKEVLDLAKGMKEYKVDWIYTGHCTGEKSFKILKECFEDKIMETYSGLEININ